MLVILGTAMVYYGLYSLLKYISFTPKCLKKDQKALWNFTLLTLLHSLIVSAAVSFFVYLDPMRLVNLTALETNMFVLKLPLYLVGFFIFDSTCRALLFKPQKSDLTRIGYQVLFVSFFMVNMYLGYNNYIIMAILSEINGIFVNIFNLLLLSRKTESDNHNATKIFYFTKGTWVLFRVCNFAWILYYSVFIASYPAAIFVSKSYFFTTILPYLFGVFVTIVLLLIHVLIALSVTCMHDIDSLLLYNYRFPWLVEWRDIKITEVSFLKT